MSTITFFFSFGTNEPPYHNPFLCVLAEIFEKLDMILHESCPFNDPSEQCEDNFSFRTLLTTQILTSTGRPLTIALEQFRRQNTSSTNHLLLYTLKRTMFSNSAPAAVLGAAGEAGRNSEDCPL